MPKGKLKYNVGSWAYARRGNRKKRMAKPRISRNLVVYGMPRSQLVRMVYTEQVRIDPGAGGVPGSCVFRANSVYDPYRSLNGVLQTGHQPLFHDQYSAIYDHYKVVGSKISILSANDYSDQNNVMGNLLTCVVNNDPSAYSSYTEATEAKGVKYVQVHERRTSKLKNTYSAKNFHNKVDVKDNEDLQGILGNTGVGSNPSSEAYYVIQAFPLYAGSNTYPICANVRIEYLTLVYDMKKIQGS